MVFHRGGAKRTWMEEEILSRKVMRVSIGIAQRLAPGALEPSQRNTPIDFLAKEFSNLELQAGEDLLSIHNAQALGCSNPWGFRLALLINFNTPILKR
ncbi:MAG: hypothetical protein AAGA18_04840 [Verrucomicrobiota bacterium]